MIPALSELEQRLARALEAHPPTSWHDFVDCGAILASPERLPGESHDEQCERLWSHDIAWIKEHLRGTHIPCSTPRCTRNANRICVASRFDHTDPVLDPKCRAHRRRGEWDILWRAETEADGCAGWLMHWTEAGCFGVAERFVARLRRWHAQTPPLERGRP